MPPPLAAPRSTPAPLSLRAYMWGTRLYELTTQRHADGRYKNGRASDANQCAEMVEEDAEQAAR